LIRKNLELVQVRDEKFVRLVPAYFDCHIMSENPAVSQAVSEEKPPETASITTSAETKPTQYKATRIVNQNWTLSC